MRVVAAFLLFAVVGCAGPGDPRLDLVLFESAEARAQRDLQVVYYLQDLDGNVASLVIPRNGAATKRTELGEPLRRELRRIGFGSTYRFESTVTVEAGERSAIDAHFAGLASTDATVGLEFKPEPNVEREPDSEFVLIGPEPTERRTRVLHVSPAGETKTLTVVQRVGAPPPELKRGDEALERLMEVFRRLGRRRR